MSFISTWVSKNDRKILAVPEITYTFPTRLSLDAVNAVEWEQQSQEHGGQEHAALYSSIDAPRLWQNVPHSSKLQLDSYP